MKRLLATMLGFIMTFAMPVMALAEHIDGSKKLYVEYNQSGSLVDNYTRLIDNSTKEIWTEQLSELQPGDDITLTIEMRQNNDSTADWYLSNAVIKTFEDKEKLGSAYTYTLKYKDPAGIEHMLYTSDKVGGKDSSEGLAEATNAMEDYFYLDSLSKGQTGRVILNVALDGETEGNVYFDRLAGLSMQFAVEPNLTPQSETATSSTNKKTETVSKDQVIEVTKTNDKTETVTVPKDTQTIRVVKNDNVVEDIVTVNRENVVTDGNVVTRVVPGDRAGLAKTGDQTTLFPVYLGIAGLGLVCLALAIRNLRNKDNGKEGGAQ